jgi:hypothetical protein
MRSALLVAGLSLAFATRLCADANLTISDVGLHGYVGTPSAVRLVVRNRSAQAELIHLQVAGSDGFRNTNTVSSDLTLHGGEERQIELPLVLARGETKVTAEATAGGSALGHDSFAKVLQRNNSLIVLICGNDDICKAVQSQIQFSGSIENRADKNRQLAFEVINDARENWWAYSGATSIVLATPLTKLPPAQQRALEDYLRFGGRLVLVEPDIADRNFLGAYRNGPAPPNGERVGKGTLFRVSSMTTLGDVFAGRNLLGVMNGSPNVGWYRGWPHRQFLTTPNFPKLRSLLAWLAAYIVVIGVVNFVVLRRLRHLEFGWISMCALALLFAVGFYYFAASRQPKEFRLDNLATYYLDAHSSSAVAEYTLRISTPARSNVAVSISDPAAFMGTDDFASDPPNSQIWAEMNRQAVRAVRPFDVRLGPPRQVELSLLKWSFQDFSLEGTREFPGTVHFVGPHRLRNDTGQNIMRAVYYDFPAGTFCELPALAPGQEVQLDTLTPKLLPGPEQQPWNVPNPGAVSQFQVAIEGATSLRSEDRGRVFTGLADGPALPVELSVAHAQNVHSLIVVSLGQP